MPNNQPNETQDSTALFRAAMRMLEQLVSELPAQKHKQLASAIEGGATVHMRLVLPVGHALPDAAFDLLLPDGQRIELATVNVEPMRHH
ncbi:hypothetical protein [Inhella crocodyli]|uniref:Uncharacterized protein n=1 Tax=Inhella crocodyli TaxID=2499851 RepID=A0A3S2UEY5_9BURK|nr:hypothetical protein [Inhella crocodyli]RVT86248.1 hypothetical protein EOD73_09455 [Inhella crocodyli]